MSTEERDESQPRPRKIIPSIRRENTDQEGERRPYNQGYNRPEGNNYERRPYNRPNNDRGGYNSYGEVITDHTITTVETALMALRERVITITDLLMGTDRTTTTRMEMTVRNTITTGHTTTTDLITMTGRTTMVAVNTITTDTIVRNVLHTMIAVKLIRLRLQEMLLLLTAQCAKEDRV
jgi:hypothetical protein